jgi:hypothetical protein
MARSDQTPGRRLRQPATRATWRLRPPTPLYQSNPLAFALLVLFSLLLVCQVNPHCERAAHHCWPPLRNLVHSLQSHLYIV